MPSPAVSMTITMVISFSMVISIVVVISIFLLVFVGWTDMRRVLGGMGI